MGTIIVIVVYALMVIFSTWYWINDDLDRRDEITYNDILRNFLISILFAMPICLVIVAKYLDEKVKLDFMYKVAYKRKGKKDV